MNSYRLNNNSLFIEGVNGCVLQVLGNLYFIYESLEDVLIWDFVGEYLQNQRKSLKIGSNVLIS